jgi:hypothetical protein
MKKLLLALSMILVPGVAFAGAYIDPTLGVAGATAYDQPPAVSDVVKAGPAIEIPKPEKIIIERIKEPIARQPKTGFSAGIENNFTIINYSTYDWSISAGIKRALGQTQSLIGFSGALLTSSDRLTRLMLGMNLYPADNYAITSLPLALTHYVTDRLLLEGCCEIITVGNGQTSYLTPSIGGRYFF